MSFQRIVSEMTVFSTSCLVVRQIVFVPNYVCCAVCVFITETVRFSGPSDPWPFPDGENTEAEGDAVEGEEEEQNEVEGAECAALTDCDVEALGCAHGLKRDAAGCDTCACHACSAIMCPMRCEHGFAQDEFGCNTCACHTCSPVLCLMHCEHGFAQDERHCNVCSCAPREYGAFGSST